MTEDVVASRKAKVVLTTSLDDNHPISEMLDDKEETFWVSTGMFPQEIMFQCESILNLESMKIVSTGSKYQSEDGLTSIYSQEYEDRIYG